jgi:regulator of sigma E protease
MSLMETLLAFVFTILVVVAFHEYGHFLAMRLFGIRVLKFSIGFGPRLLHWKSKKSGTDYVIAAIPLGGYVKPFDSRADNSLLEGGQGDAVGTADEDFSQKPAWQRFITYAAGPFANFVLAFVFYWLIAIHGQPGLIPLVGKVAPHSTAAQAGLQPGDEVTAVNGERVRTWQQVTNVLLGQIGSDKPALFTIDRQGKTVRATLPLGEWATNPEAPPLGVLGISPRGPGTRLGEILPDSAALKAGFRTGDEIRAVNGKAVTSWDDWVQVVQAHPGEAMSVSIERQGQPMTLMLTPDTIEQDGETIGRAGVMIGGLTQIRYGPMSAFPAAWDHLKQETGMIVGAMLRLFEGKLSVKTLGGPITIAKAAGETAAIGIAVFLGFLAFFSISLGALNLLPVPLLDGGWMVFCVAEMVMRRPLPERFLAAAQNLGLSLVVLLMVVAIYNDLIRQFG